MELAMTALERFSEKEADYYHYQNQGGQYSNYSNQDIPIPFCYQVKSE